MVKIKSKLIHPKNTNINVKGNFKTHFLAYIILIIVPTCMYFQSLSYGYSNNDDDVIMQNNIEFLHDISNLPSVFVLDAWFGRKEIELYRPLQGISFMLDAQRGENIVLQSRITSILLHILCCICIFHLLLQFRFSINISILGALVYAVHFLFLHTVLWLPARGDLLLALFSFLSFIFFIKFIETAERKHFLLHIIFFGLALFSKETAILLPFIFLAYTYLFYRATVFKKKNYILIVCYAAIYFLFSYLRKTAVLESGHSLSVSGFIKNLPTIPETVTKMFLPVNFSTMPAFNFIATLAGIVIMIGFLVFFILKKERFDKMTVFSMLWFFILIIPGMAYYPVFSFFTYEYLDHRSYLFCFGILLMLLNLFHSYGFDTKKSYWFIFIPVLLYLAMVNLFYSRSYENPLMYSEQAIKSNPRSALAYFIHGNEVAKRGDTAQAMNNFSRALAIHPKYAEARFNHATLLFQQKKYDQSLEDLNMLISYLPDYGQGEAFYLRGKAKARLRDMNGAYADLEAAVKLNPTNPGMKQTLETCNRERSHAIENNAAIMSNNAGIAAAKSGKYKEALIYFTKAVNENPKFEEAVSNLETCKRALKEQLKNVK